MGGLGTEFWLGSTAGVAFAALGGVAWLRLRSVRQERDLRRSYAAGGCARCGYDVRSTSGRCPECGDDLLAQAVAYWRDRL
jgi:hypothetical protein